MKKDKDLGNKIHQYLINKGVETPMTGELINKEQKHKNIVSLFSQIMEELNLDLNDDSLKGTPDRVAKMFLNEMFYGLDYNNFP